MSVPTADGDVAGVLAVLSRTRFCWSSEADLQEGMAGAFAAGGLQAEREARLDTRSRIDFLVGRVGIEVKVAGPWREVLRQVERYARSERVGAIVVVTAKVPHTRLPSTVGGKPVTVYRVGSVL